MKHTFRYYLIFYGRTATYSLCLASIFVVVYFLRHVLDTRFSKFAFRLRLDFFFLFNLYFTICVAERLVNFSKFYL